MNDHRQVFAEVLAIPIDLGLSAVEYFWIKPQALLLALLSAKTGITFTPLVGKRLGAVLCPKSKITQLRVKMDL
jgi:hypothetical protein